MGIEIPATLFPRTIFSRVAKLRKSLWRMGMGDSQGAILCISALICQKVLKVNLRFGKLLYRKKAVIEYIDSLINRIAFVDNDHSVRLSLQSASDGLSVCSRKRTVHPTPLPLFSPSTVDKTVCNLSYHPQYKLFACHMGTVSKQHVHELPVHECVTSRSCFWCIQLLVPKSCEV